MSTERSKGELCLGRWGLEDQSEYPVGTVEDILSFIQNLEEKLKTNSATYFRAKNLLLKTLTSHECLLLIGALKGQNDFPSRRLYHDQGDPNASRAVFSAGIRLNKFRNSLLNNTVFMHSQYNPILLHFKGNTGFLGF